MNTTNPTNIRYTRIASRSRGISDRMSRNVSLESCNSAMNIVIAHSYPVHSTTAHRSHRTLGRARIARSPRPGPARPCARPGPYGKSAASRAVFSRLPSPFLLTFYRRRCSFSRTRQKESAVSAFRGWRARIRDRLRASRADRDVSEEMAFHLELEAAKNERAGMTPGEARRRALVSFGGVERHREAHRDGRSLGWIDDLVRDVRHGMRGFIRAPLFAVTA